MNKFNITKYMLSLTLAATAVQAFAQANISPAKKQDKTIAITGATVHVGNGTVLENGTVVFSKGKIVSVSAGGQAPQDASVINAAGKHLYPGIIAPVTNLGLTEIESVKATLDFREIGNYNPHIRSLIAYNTDSKVQPTLRSNGVLMAQVTPQGGVLAGSSSVVQLDAWNWEDAVVRADDAIHLNWPQTPRFRGGFGRIQQSPEALQEATNRSIDELKAFFNEARAYADQAKPEVTNTRFEAMKRLFTGQEKLFVSADSQKDIVAAIRFAKSMGINPVLVGGDEAYLVTDFLKENNVPVVLKQPHSLPANNDDDVNMPYKNAAVLSKAGLTVVLSIDGYWQQRNLPFMAGTAAAWGMDREKALSAVTLNTAQILGIAQTAGSIETGKDATLFISAGDALDMKTNRVEKAFIQGRDINLDNLHKQLDKKFSDKYSGK